MLFDEKIKNCEKGQKELICLLQLAMQDYSYISKDIVKKIEQATGVPCSEIYSVATFYKHFLLEKPGLHTVKVCKGTACHVKKSDCVLKKLESILEIEEGETTKDGMFTLKSVSCLGCCSLSPVMMIDDDVYGQVKEDCIEEILEGYRQKSKK